MFKRRWWLMAVILTISLLFSRSIALADEQPGVRGYIRGRSYISPGATATYAEYTGETALELWVWQLVQLGLMEMPDEMLLTLHLFKGDTLIGDGAIVELTPGMKLRYLPGEYEAYVDDPDLFNEPWQGAAWHYAWWEIDNIIDSAATYDPPLVVAEVQPVYARLDAYCGNSRQSMQNWHRVDFLRSSEMLKGLLGPETGASLDKMFRYDLRSCLKPGDRMPGLLVSPDGSSAVALFFHADKTMTVIELLKTSDRTWDIKVAEGDKFAEEPVSYVGTE